MTRYFLIILLFSPWLCVALPLVNPNDTFRYRKGINAPQANWLVVAESGLDSSWLPESQGFFGYGDSMPGTVLGDMRQTTTPANQGYRTFYVRRTFTIPDGQPLTNRLILRTDYDDGFVAWIVNEAGAIAAGDYANAPGITTNAPTPPNLVPAYDEGPSTTHESSIGGNNAQPARVTDLGALSLFPAGNYTLCAMAMNESLTSSDCILHLTLTTETIPQPTDCTVVGGVLAANSTWTKTNSPYCVTSQLTVAAGITLRIDPGVIVRFAAGVGMSVPGRILAEGTAAEHIVLTREGSSGTWGRISMDQTGVARQEQRFVYVDISYASSSSSTLAPRESEIYMDHVRFTNVNSQMVDMVGSNCTVLNCEFNTISSGELIHFSNMPSGANGGKALIKGCLFGTSNGYNDIVDFTGGNRPGPIVRFVDNVFTSGVDDCFDMDGTDAHIEGNVFLNIRKDSSRSSSSNPITTGSNGADLSQLVICRNLFYNTEHVFMQKDRGSGILQNNTIVMLTSNPFSNNNGEASGIIMFGEPWRGFPYGDGAIFEGNIGDDLQIGDPFPLYSEALAANGTFLVRKQNCLRGFTIPGLGNLNTDPMLINTTDVTAQNIRASFAIKGGSPCKGTGPNGLDMGALVAGGASISGEPHLTTASRNATLFVAGPGIWAYKWRINGGPWSGDISLVSAAIWNGGQFTATMLDNSTPIRLSNLADGTYTVEVLGKDSAGFFQEVPTVSKTWTVIAGGGDTDGDGMPDEWEMLHGLNVNDVSDAMVDKDGDGSINRTEYVAGTDPSDRASVFSAGASLLPDRTIEILFAGVVGKTYRIEASETLSSNWMRLHRVPPIAASGPIRFVDGEATTLRRRFYRVITPAE